MYKVSVMYPNQDGAKFDLEYYRTKHMPLVMKQLQPYGLLKTGIDRGHSGGAGTPPPYLCVGHLYFEGEDGYDRGIKAVGPVLRQDIANFTNVTPVRLVSEVIE